MARVAHMTARAARNEHLMIAGRIPDRREPSRVAIRHHSNSDRPVLTREAAPSDALRAHPNGTRLRILP
jgi:hypothetical protein